ncbi:hypothetical protein AGDE_14581 [Angomonas deanei]|nr:hypothetical protein AGDE_14581 [Angomonas deanei]|eukprot:EPY20600.1 hypothetical protein AGDE_14581 [Angomonas deanei]
MMMMMMMMINFIIVVDTEFKNLCGGHLLLSWRGNIIVIVIMIILSCTFSSFTRTAVTADQNKDSGIDEANTEDTETQQ